MRRWFSAGICLAFLVSGSLHAQQLDNSGTDFILAFMPNDSDAPFGQQVVGVHLTSAVATTATVEYPMNNPTFSQTVAVTPGQITVVNLPIEAANLWVPNMLGQDNCVCVISPDEVVCYMNNRDFFTSDAAVAMPVDTYGTEYVVAGFPAVPLVAGAQFVLCAVQDNTSVTITPTVDMMGGPLAGVPFTLSLMKGEGYYGLALDPTQSMTGTWVVADKPVGLTNGSYCASVPNQVEFCDHIFEMAQPIAAWGDEFITANLPNRPGGSIYRILASEDSTTITQDGTTMMTIDRGQFYEVGPLAGNHVFAADKPIYVVQYMTGSGSPGAVLGDPSMCNMIPSQQYLKDYTFATIGNNEFADHFITVIAANADVGNLTLDGVAIPATDYTPVAGTIYSVAVMPLAEGAHTTSSANGHAITVQGYNFFNSYCYPGGMSSEFINTPGDPTGDENPPTCTIEINANSTQGELTVEDDRDSEDVNGNGLLDPGEDLNNNGIIDIDTGIASIVFQAGSVNLELDLGAFAPGAPSFSFFARLIDSFASGTGVVIVTDGAGNETTCPVDLDGLDPLGDNNDPTCVIDIATNNTSATVTLTDSKSTEDVNGNGVLDTGEDLNNNGIIDVDSGIKEVTLEANSMNVTFTVPTFTPGDPSVVATAELTDMFQDGNATVRVEDQSGNVFTCALTLTGLDPLGDTLDPICSIGVDASGQSALGTVTDDRPSEDVNGNGMLDAGEDLNNNSIIDVDSGIASVVLDVGGSNVALSVDPFTAGAASVTFTASLVDASQDGLATVRITDVAGNETTCPVDLEGSAGEGCPPTFWKHNPCCYPCAWINGCWTCFSKWDRLYCDFKYRYLCWYGFQCYRYKHIMCFNGGTGCLIIDKAGFLLKHGAAAILNAAHPDVDYPLTYNEVRCLVNYALWTCDINVICQTTATLEAYNNLGCPELNCQPD